MRWAGTRDAESSARSESVRLVRLVRWPADAGLRDELAERGVPRLLLVDPGVVPPRLEAGEDWIRLPADERDVAARLQRLAVLHDRRRRRPWLRGTVIDHVGHWTVPDDAVALLGMLVDRFGQLVTWDELVQSLGPDAGDEPEIARRVAALGSHVAPAGLAVHAVGGRGVVLAPGRPGGRS